MMKKFYVFFAVLFLAIFALQVAAQGQRETLTGTVLSYGSGFNTRATTGTFTLILNGETSDRQAQQFLGILQESGQESLQDAIRREDLGNFSVGARVGPRINVVRQSTENGKRRIFIVFERWTEFGEFRGGYQRSRDYPFGVIELFIDERTGKGEGTYIAAAKIRWDNDRKTGRSQVEIENFATYPAKLLGVTSRNR